VGDAFYSIVHGELFWRGGATLSALREAATCGPAAAAVTEERQTLLREGMRAGRNTSAERAQPLRVQ
jgi:hypothetical protein